MVYNVSMAEDILTTERLYTEVNDRIGNSPVYFLNHGYSPSYPEFDNMPFKNQLSLYKKCIENIDLDNKTVLEVACGRGGGSKWISDNYNVKMYGCDVTPVHIQICKRNESEKLQYKFGRADNLPYDPETFDVLINIESLQSYTDVGVFFEKAFNVLKHHGKIVIMDSYGLSDIAKSNGFKDLETIKRLAELWFENIEIEIITDNVMNSCLEDVQYMKDHIENVDVANFMSEVSDLSYRKYKNEHRGYFKLTGIKVSPDLRDLAGDWDSAYTAALRK